MRAQKTAVIIGAGPAGLTAAYELLTRTDLRPIVLEKSQYMGGIARTINYKGNRIDLGGHRFFSKSDRVMNWWLEHLPLQKLPETKTVISKTKAPLLTSPSLDGPDPDKEDRVMLLRDRKSRVYFSRRFFDYPIRLSPATFSRLGLWRSLQIAGSYLKSLSFPIRDERTLEDFFINRFGRELYTTFFKTYTEKVWGVPCCAISAEWGRQRVKGLSVGKSALHFVKKLLFTTQDIAQKNTETSLVEQFLYPKYGPGQMWEEVARKVREKGGLIQTNHEVSKLYLDRDRVRGVETVGPVAGERRYFECDVCFSTMAIKDLVRALDPSPPAEVKQISEGLMYRDFITVGLLVKELNVGSGGLSAKGSIRDNWIYLQEPSVRAGRLQIFNNWSPYLVADPETLWIGFEYFCNDTDPLWGMNDEDISRLARHELSQIGILGPCTVLDSTVARMEKAYPAYFGTYDRFPVLRSFFDHIQNLFLIGRNGMHRYNNQDHSMLTAMVSVDNIAAGVCSKDNIWKVNTEQEYLEEK